MPASVRSLLLALVLLGLGMATSRCDSQGPADPDRLVVEAFLETGRPLPPIRLRRTRPPTAGTTGADAAEGASLTLTLDGEPVAYGPGDDPGTYVPQTDVGPLPEDVPFSLTATWRGETARASGRTPPPVELRRVCIEAPDRPVRAILVDSLRRDSLDIPAQQGFIYPIDVQVEWDDPAAAASDSFWIRAQLVPTNAFSSRIVSFFLQPAEVNEEAEFVDVDARRRWNGVYAVPVDTSTAPLPEHRLTVAVARGDADFASFATSRTDPDRREPISNVRGGLGIATAIALDSLSFPVRPSTPTCDDPAP